MLMDYIKKNLISKRLKINQKYNDQIWYGNQIKLNVNDKIERKKSNLKIIWHQSNSN